MRVGVKKQDLFGGGGEMCEGEMQTTRKGEEGDHSFGRFALTQIYAPPKPAIILFTISLRA